VDFFNKISSKEKTTSEKRVSKGKFEEKEKE